jgi:hypothetical protein
MGTTRVTRDDAAHQSDATEVMSHYDVKSCFLFGVNETFRRLGISAVCGFAASEIMP